MTKDMTSGSPIQLILSFTIPLVLGNLFQQFYSMVDTMIVGRFLGTNPLAAVGSTGSLNSLIVGFCLGICSGFAIPVAQRFGSKNFEELRQFVGNILWLSVGFSAVFTLLTVTFCRPMLIAMNTPLDILDDAHAYIVIIFGGIPITFFYNILAGLLRALGDSKTPSLFLILTSLVNILLDLLLVVVFPLGVSGAAIATISAQLVSGLLCFFLIWIKFPVLHLNRKHLQLQKFCIRELIADGIPMALQTSITAIGSMILQVSINALGVVVVASFTAANKLSGLFSTTLDAMGVSMSTYGGQNIGAQRMDRIHPGLKAGLLLGSVYSLFSLVIILLFGKPLSTLFVDSPEIIENSYQLLVITVLFFIPLTGVNIFRLLLQGMGYSKIAVFAGVAEMLARSLTGLFLVPAFGFSAACFAGPIAWIMADAFLIPTYFWISKRIGIL